MDAADNAQAQTDLDLALALKNRKRITLPNVGLCHYCSDPIEKVSSATLIAVMITNK